MLLCLQCPVKHDTFDSLSLSFPAAVGVCTNINHKGSIRFLQFFLVMDCGDMKWYYGRWGMFCFDRNTLFRKLHLFK